MKIKKTFSGEIKIHFNLILSKNEESKPESGLEVMLVNFFLFFTCGEVRTKIINQYKPKGVRIPLLQLSLWPLPLSQPLSLSLSLPPSLLPQWLLRKIRTNSEIKGKPDPIISGAWKCQSLKVMRKKGRKYVLSTSLKFKRREGNTFYPHL